MRYILKLLALVLLFSQGTMLAAQDTDNGAIVSWIEGKLSGPNRIIKLRDIEGALSSNAVIGTISISDTEGEWLRIDDAQINWKRSALLTGSLQVESLSAAVIEISRAPLPDQSLPTPEAGGFALPDLPLDISITEISTPRIILGQDLMGLAAELSATASLQMDTTGLALKLDAIRLDDAGGQVALAVEYSRDNSVFNINISLEEPENGMIANALNLEGRPAIDAQVSGQGPLDELAILLTLDAAGTRLIAGDLNIGESEAGRTFAGQLNGNLEPLLPTEYRNFFEGSSTIDLNGVLRTEGGVSIPNLRLQTADMLLTGNLETLADGFPSYLRLNAQIGRDDGSTIILPAAGGFGLTNAALDIGFGEDENGAWDISFTAENLSDASISAAQVSGRMLGTSHDLLDASKRGLSGDLQVSAQGLSAVDSDIAQALGEVISVSAKWSWVAQTPLMLHSAQILGNNADLHASGSFSGLDFDGGIGGSIHDLAVLAPLVSQPLSGEVTFQSTGKLALLGGNVDTQLSGTGQNIMVGDPRIDDLLAGRSSFVSGLKRDESGISATGLSITSDTAKIATSAVLTSEAIDANGTAELVELSTLLQGLDGAGRVEFTASGRPAAPEFLIDLKAQSGAGALVTGNLGEDLQLSAEIKDFPAPFLHMFAADLALEGLASGSVLVSTVEDAPKVDFDVISTNTDAGILKPYGLGSLALEAKGAYYRNEISLIAAHIEGRDGLSIDLSGSVPLNLENIDAQFSGSAPLSAAADMLEESGIVATGYTDFDMKMQGALAKPSFFGKFSVRDTNVSVQRFKVSFDQVEASATASGRSISLTSASARSTAGGDIRVNGQIQLAPGFPGRLEVSANDLVYSDGRMFSVLLDTNLGIDGQLTSGPSLRGSIDIDNAEIQVPSGSSASDILVDVSHNQPPTPVRRTLNRAGLSPSGGNVTSENASLDLDLAISSPGRIFVRGRGLDAELGGAIRVQGASPNIRTSGRFDLLRGRMDLLGHRLEFTEGTVTVNGNLDPQINFIARTTADDLDITVQLAGLISAPELILSSVPQLPQDEILARLIFARGMDDLSIFQIAQLASAVADLSGRSSGGLVSQLREIAGLDNLYIRTIDGETSVAAGKYLQENIYSEIEIDTSGETRFSINLDVIDDVKARADVSSEGDTEIGIFFEKDY